MARSSTNLLFGEGLETISSLTKSGSVNESPDCASSFTETFSELQTEQPEARLNHARNAPKHSRRQDGCSAIFQNTTKIIFTLLIMRSSYPKVIEAPHSVKQGKVSYRLVLSNFSEPHPIHECY